jgi:DNA-binding protein H-NS
MKEFDIKPEVIVAAFGKTAARGATRAVKKSAPSTRAPVPVKYKHPETGATWTGRGKPPRWIVDAEASGKSRNDFLV